MEREELLLLGKIDGKIDGISQHLTAQDARLDGIEGRLRTVEQKAAVTGAISGTISGSAISIGIALVAEGLKQWYRGHGGGQ